MYIRKMSYGYGQDVWGESMEKEFEAALSGTDAVIHSRTTSLYMSLDNDDFFGFAGALAQGVKHVDSLKTSPPLMVADMREKGNERYVSIERFMGMELRSRYFNPAYVEAITKEGYAGAREVMKSVDNMFGWQVVYPEVITNEKWQEFYEVWMKDRYNLKTTEFFDEHNPYARQSMSARMLEAVRKGFWKADANTQKELAKMYVDNVVKNGVSCSYTTCDHPQLQQFIKGVAVTNSAIPAADVTKWVSKVESATSKTLDEAMHQRNIEKAQATGTARQAQELAKQAAEPGKQQTSAGKTKVQGYKMESEQVVKEQWKASRPVTIWAYLMIIAFQAGIVLLGAWKRLYL
jgi:cobaltochelatase CobN